MANSNAAAKVVRVVANSEFCFVAELDNGGVRFGIYGMASKSVPPGLADYCAEVRRVGASAFPDPDDFDEAVSGLFAFGASPRAMSAPL